MTQSSTDQGQSINKESDSSSFSQVVVEESSPLKDKEDPTTNKTRHNENEIISKTPTPPRFPRWTELMKKRHASKEKNLFHLGDTEHWHISVQPNRNSSHSLRMIIHDKQTQHKLAFALLTTNRNRSSLMGLYIDPKHRAQGLTRRILSLWLQWCIYADPTMHPQTEVIRKPLLCCVLEHALGFVVSSSSSSLPVFLVQSNKDDQRIHLHSIPPQCLRGAFSARDIQREGLTVQCSVCLRRNEEQQRKEGPEKEEQPEQKELVDQLDERKVQQPRRRRIHLNARYERREPWKTLPDDPILQTALRPDQLRLILLGKL
ncbi:hypothetical protein FisN_30Lh111 [Fistulifera solaris]|uniref:Uncharacterized protein n=1 Tax=Fistulifera solaris TaxID=1519565 RepID=A0A1Z5JIQ8_FISSO|nr:hypothetical protein FisN_30Lh111 [Fistulifera solaris]|eukprot:GAX13816.1 hypothetical protein FisN_30Lh111 [Fistulifera solaris]